RLAWGRVGSRRRRLPRLLLERGRTNPGHAAATGARARRLGRATLGASLDTQSAHHLDLDRAALRRLPAGAVRPAPARAARPGRGHGGGLLGRRRVEAGRDLLDRRSLVLAHLVAAFLVRFGDAL